MRRGRHIVVHNPGRQPRLHRQHQRRPQHTRRGSLQSRNARHPVLQWAVHHECHQRLGYYHWQLLGRTQCRLYQLHNIQTWGRDGGIAEGIHRYCGFEHDAASRFVEQLFRCHFLLIGETRGSSGSRGMSRSFLSARAAIQMGKKVYATIFGSGCGSVGPSIRFILFYCQHIEI